MVSSEADICGMEGPPGEGGERAEAMGNSERQTEEMKERMLEPEPEPEPEKGTQRAAKRHEELLDAILQQTEAIRIYDERSPHLVEEEVDIEPD
jgi:hypothetical protein